MCELHDLDNLAMLARLQQSHAALFNAKKEYSAAESAIEHAIGLVADVFDRTHPFNVELQLDLSNVYALQRRWTEAKESARKAISIELDGWNDKLRLAKGLLELGL